MTGSKENVDTELHVVILGPDQKHVLFKKLCRAADKYEKHVHYQDVHYLHVNKPADGTEEVIEITDPGLGHTGNREMAIRKCNLALIYCSVSTTSDLQRIESLIPDFDLRKTVPVRFLFDVDEVAIDEEDSSSTGISSVSEGYESDTDLEGPKRKNSMDKIRRQNEEGMVTMQQISELSTRFGPDVRVEQISSNQMVDARGLLETIMEEAAKSKKKTTPKKRLLSIALLASLASASSLI
ncbi:unnamed protein product, partial [Mesorhabditis belari]|uniref:Uncharacterized protein n=1 Tax=Mesorhabditis belari TaxID=2138241 RepID=A0AAF3EP17_9BILA